MVIMYIISKIMNNKFSLQKKGEVEFDFLQKIIIIGDSGVGKSNILLRFSQGTYIDHYMPTIGLNVVYKVVTIDDVKVKLQIWDTGGQDRFKTITKNYFRNSQGVLVVFGVDSRDSYYSVQSWIDDLSQTTGDKTCILLVGNKQDLTKEREVSQEQAKILADNYGVEYMECSAKTGENIQQIFAKLGKSMKTQFIDNSSWEKENNQDNKVKIHHLSKHHRKCCQK